jgi:hypothetical protein
MPVEGVEIALPGIMNRGSLVVREDSEFIHGLFSSFGMGEIGRKKLYAEQALEK